MDAFAIAFFGTFILLGLIGLYGVIIDKYDKDEHREGLIKLYEDWQWHYTNETVLPKTAKVFDLALEMLKRDVHPKAVEGWVVKTEKYLRQNLV